MADKANKVPENVSGPFYVDGELCIDCGVCTEVAPAHFAQDDQGYAYVKRQPDNDAERKVCREAMEECPVEAIGDDA